MSHPSSHYASKVDLSWCLLCSPLSNFLTLGNIFLIRIISFSPWEFWRTFYISKCITWSSAACDETKLKTRKNGKKVPVFFQKKYVTENLCYIAFLTAFYFYMWFFFQWALYWRIHFHETNIQENMKPFFCVCFENANMGIHGHGWQNHCLL